MGLPNGAPHVLYSCTAVKISVYLVIPASDELIHVLLLFLNYFMTGSHPPVYKTSLYDTSK